MNEDNCINCASIQTILNSMVYMYTRVHDLLVGIFPVSFSRYGIDLDLIIHGTDLWKFLVGGTETERAKCLLSRRPHRGLIRLLQFQQYWRSSDLKMSITTTLYLIITIYKIYSTSSPEWIFNEVVKMNSTDSHIVGLIKVKSS